MNDPTVFGDGPTNNQLVQKPANIPANQVQQPPEQQYQDPPAQPSGKILDQSRVLFQKLY